MDVNILLKILQKHATVNTLGALVAGSLLLWLLFTFTRPDAEKAVSFAVQAPDQCKPGWHGLILQNPSIKVPDSSAVQCYAPATGANLGLINPSTPSGIDRVVQRATSAQLKWAQTSFSERRRVLRSLLTFVLENQESIVRAACLDSGKTRVDAVFGEVLVTVEKLKWTLDHGEAALRPERRPGNLLMFYKRNEVHYEPLGVVSACVSWNYPFHNIIGPVISAIFSGNAIVVKNSEQTAWSTVYYCNIVRACLKACGHEQDLVHAVTCWPQTASHLTSHPGISHLTFIGSRPIAHEVAKSAAKVLTPLCVELGGKDAAIILDDPSCRPIAPGEMGRIASIIMRGVFQSAGQNCIGIERIIAMPQAYQTLINMLEPRIKSMRLGNDLDAAALDGGQSDVVDMGAMVSPASFSRLESLIDEAVAQGARLLAGGRRYMHPKYPKGSYFTPTLLVDVSPNMRIAQEELFAPVALLMRVETVDAAIATANDSAFGLGGSVFGPTTSSVARAQLRRVAHALKTGMVAVNDFAVFYAVQLPFGGIKGSGYGRFAGEEGLRALCNAKSICIDRWPSMIKTAIPRKLDYPMQGDGAWEMGRGVVEVGYGEDWKRRVKGITRMMGL